MAKDPAFLFYSNDFDSGTKFLTDEQVGKYLRLLMSQHQHGHLTEKQMLFICKTRDEEIFKKFVKDADGNYFNEKLDAEINRRKAFSASRRKNGVNKYKKSAYAGAHAKIMHPHMETVTETKTVIETKDETKKTKYGETVLLKQSEYTKLCADYGQQATQAAIEYLDMYKQEKNYTTKSDYNTLKRWVMGAITKNNKTHEKHKQQSGQYGPTDYIIADDGTRIYEKDIDFSKFNR